MKLSPSEISEIGLFLRVRMRTMVRLGSNETELLSLLWGTVFTIDCEIYASIEFRILEYFNKLIIPFAGRRIMVSFSLIRKRLTFLATVSRTTLLITMPLKMKGYYSRYSFCL